MNNTASSDFTRAYNALNPEQQKVVDTLHGPIIINAGPGTGKTQVLSLRICNLLSQLDISAHNILCLTYTDAGARNMRERLTHFIGTDAYSIGIHTFHGFSADIINHHPQLFFGGTTFTPIDSVTQFEICHSIFSQLPLSSPISSKHPLKGYVYLSSVIDMIGNLKKEGLSPSEFTSLLRINEEFFKQISPTINEIFDTAPSFSSRSKTWIDTLHAFAQQFSTLFAQYSPSLDTYLSYFPPHKARYLYQHHNCGPIYQHLLEQSVAACIEMSKSTPFSDFKKLIYSPYNGTHSIKEYTKYDTLYAAADVYERYTSIMYEQGYYDFSDMILEVLRVLETHEDLVSDLQEQYQYILVDEFQDTNGSQLQLIDFLLPSHDESPHILVVGDTDQTIYKFQGAQVGNLESFGKRFSQATRVNMYRNYRSNQDILDFAQHVITQSNNRESRPHLVSAQL